MKSYCLLIHIASNMFILTKNGHQDCLYHYACLPNESVLMSNLRYPVFLFFRNPIIYQLMNHSAMKITLLYPYMYLLL